MSSSKLLPLLGLLLVLYAAAIAADSCKDGALYAAEATNEYYHCVNGALQHRTCPGDESYFDAHSSACRHGKPPSNYVTSPPSTDDSLEVLGMCQRIGQTGDLTDCKLYYHCAVKGAAVQRGDCPDNHIFDLVKFSCVRGTC
ncbi:hypothetical protein KR093_008863 [Drosophila rubida]|uniref:Chitin-binding type-2 domain-containing protein n=1 Tax=Drosophila rubida TaxID=30044 RepID=A0AAD4JYJ1_9MUSC|nr:hypothetical protein KR093_008863 [Drosophila rubida]